MRRFLCCALLAFGCAGPVLAAPAASFDPIQFQPFPPAEVELLDGPFREAMLRNRNYLLELDPDRLLSTFRSNVNLHAQGKPYGGWESPNVELRGHSLGHYLTACSLMYSASGEAEFKRRVDHMVQVLAECQKAAPAAGYSPGYISAFPESFIDRVENRKPVWAPWYTLHKIYAGLLDAHELCGNQQALQVMTGAADWIGSRMQKLTPAQIQASLEMEFGGMNEVLANLYGVTRDPRHLELSKAFDHQRIYEPMRKREDQLTGLHANTQVPKLIGAARQYELTGDQEYRDLARFFWDRVALHRSYVIGGHSDREHFFPTNEFARHLSAETTETCNTYNMLKLTRHLFAWSGDPQYAEFYERALYNHILASQDPLRGMYVYLMSLRPGHFKSYSLPEDSFWCCVGTGMENHARYHEGIFFRQENTLRVNLFIPAEVNWREQGVRLRQETRFPEADESTLSITAAKPAKWTLEIRYPSWSGPLELKVNGRKQKVKATPGGYVALTRKWRTGDVVTVRTPMSLRTESLPGVPDQVALLYGPIVLAGQLGTNNLPSPYIRNQTEQVRLPVPEVPVFVSSDSLLAHLGPVPGKPLWFRTWNLGKPEEVMLQPFYRTHHERYTVYWQTYTPETFARAQAKRELERAQERELQARTIDLVHPGEQQSEIDHDVKSANSGTGSAFGRHFRHGPNGWFSYRLKVNDGQPALLNVTYWGGETGSREFEILVDEKVVATQKLHQDRPGEFFEVNYPIPADLTRGKSSVTVTFRAKSGNIAGGIFGLRLLKVQ